MNISRRSPKRAKSINWLSALLLTIWVLLVSLAAETMGDGQTAHMSGGQDRTAEEVESIVNNAGGLPARLVSMAGDALCAPAASEIGG